MGTHRYSTILLFFFGLLQRLLSWIPLGPLLRLAAWLGTKFGARRPRETGVNLAQIKLAKSYLRKNPDIAPDNCRLEKLSTEELSKSVFAHVAQALGESLLIPKLTRVVEPGDPPNTKPVIAHVTSSGQEYAYEVCRQGKGAIALSGHLGSIELLAAYHVRCGIPLSVVARLPNYPFLATLLQELRTNYGVETLWRDERTATRNFVKAIRRGGVVAALIDQDTKLESLYAPFFGVQAAYPTTLIKLAVRNKLPILTSFIVRTGPLQHHITTEPIEYDAEDPEVLQKVVNTFSARLEEFVCRYPEQWIWWHRRWRRRPEINYEKTPDALPSTRGYLEWIESALN